ncbi:zinc-binding dehydrogenase [Actinokineospora iranica]|uniref:zinc-binding dehydrogenase n=1 Tax=Actinokineospora iranica TaxID=1271860 RepID=UPI000B857F36|nr:zinc-binding dehydrogenase [Actinokineospora iranica]
MSTDLSQNLRGLVCRELGADLRTLAEHIDAGRLTPVLDRTYPLADAPEAIAHVHSGQARGKVVITV